MTQELPKQELLLKLLGLSTSANDAEALSAIRKANELMARSGWTWEMLLHEKIKIIPNPFTGVGDPRIDRPETSQTPSKYPPPYAPPPRPPQTPPRPDPWFFADGASVGASARPQMGPQNAGPLPRKSARNAKYRPSAGEL
jgi:hypothetical protein